MSSSNSSLDQSAGKPMKDRLWPKLTQQLDSVFIVHLAIGSQPYVTYLEFDTGRRCFRQCLSSLSNLSYEPENAGVECPDSYFEAFPACIERIAAKWRLPVTNSRHVTYGSEQIATLMTKTDSSCCANFSLGLSFMGFPAFWSGD